jgi:hypothetical protein
VRAAEGVGGAAGIRITTDTPATLWTAARSAWGVATKSPGGRGGGAGGEGGAGGMGSEGGGGGADGEGNDGVLLYSQFVFR